MGSKMAIRLLFVVRLEDRRQTWWGDSVPDYMWEVQEVSQETANIFLWLVRHHSNPCTTTTVTTSPHDPDAGMGDR